MVKSKRVCKPAEPGDGARFLVERLWPRGIKKESLQMEASLKEAAPTDALRRWFAHDPQKWDDPEANALRFVALVILNNFSKSP